MESRDVYKRQAGRRVLPRFLGLLLYFGSLLTSITVSDIFITVTVITVSYTHLDVYKRQTVSHVY